MFLQHRRSVRIPDGTVKYKRLSNNIFTMMYILKLLSSLLLLSLVQAQQSPSLFVDKFNTSVSYRTNVCDRQRLLWNGTVQFPDALKGLALTVVITNYSSADEESKFFTLEDNKIKVEDPGLFAVVLDEVARRAGFTWRNSFCAVPPLTAETDEDKTWTDILEWGVKTFDISMERWGISIDRMSSEVSFPEGWWDSSIVFVEHFKHTQMKSVVDIWSFFKPFSKSVWIMICVAIVVTGLLYWYLEYLDVDSDVLVLDPLGSIFYAATTFTGHFGFRPNTSAARILGFSFTFWTLIVSAAYTANLASFLVSPTISVFQVPTVQDALRKNATLCVQKDALIHEMLKADFPGLRLVPKEKEQDIYDSLRVDPEKGGCVAAAHQYNTFSIYKRNKDANFDCTVASEGNVIKIVPAGMATAIDTGGAFCTSLVSHVLDFYLTEMLEDGFVEKAWIDHLNKVGTIECVEEARPGGHGGDEDETFSLGLQDVGGIFILHGIASAAAIALALFQFYHHPLFQFYYYPRNGSSLLQQRREASLNGGGGGGGGPSDFHN
jgi:hypothetical protein